MSRARPLIVELSSTDAPDDSDGTPHDEEDAPAAQHSLQELTLTQQPSHAAAVEEAVTGQHAVPMPLAAAFTQLDAAAEGVTPTVDSQQHSIAAAAALRSLGIKLAAVVPSDIDFGPKPAANALMSRRPNSASATDAEPTANRRGLRSGVLIEEVTDEAKLGAEQLRVSAAEVVLLCALYAADNSLASTWVSADTNAASRSALGCLAGKQAMEHGRRNGEVPHAQLLRGNEGAGSDAGAADEAALLNIQRLIMRVLPEVLRLLRPLLGEPRKLSRQTKAQTHMPPITFKEGDPLTPPMDCFGGLAVTLPREIKLLRLCTEVSSFERLLAARQLAWLVRSLRGDALGSGLPYLLPAVLAALDDPSPPVECQGATSRVCCCHHVCTCFHERDDDCC